MPQAEKIKVSGCIVAYGGYEEIEKAADSVLQNTEAVDFSLFIVDNNSPDDTAQKLKANFSQKACVIALDENVGFGRGHNSCLDKLDSQYHAVINPDIMIDTDAISEICSYMQANPEVAIVTPQLRFPSGEIQNVAKRRPSLMALIARQLPFKCLKGYEKHYLMLDEDLSCIKDVEFCSGCFFVIRTDIYKKIGGFDTDYFMYVEDADITQKALRHGRAVYLPSTYVYHAWHRKTRGNLSHFFMQLKSMLLYFKKWGFKFK